MNSQEIRAIQELVARVASVLVTGVLSVAEAESIQQAMKEFETSLQGTLGNGVCICQLSPQHIRNLAIKMHCEFTKVDHNMLLDHRCPHHGEKAQPALWGRHKIHELFVTPAQWLSLGVERP